MACNNTKNSESVYGASSSATIDSSRQRQQIYQQNKASSIGKRNGFRSRDQQATMPQKIHAETYQLESNDNHQNDTIAKSKISTINGSFHSFAAANQQSMTSRPQMTDDNRLLEVNNNHLASNYQENLDKRGYTNGNFVPNSYENRSRATDSSMNLTAVTNQPQIYTNQRNSRHPIYSNHAPNGNSETPI